jgi:O-acetyl-ADP-ribose deacetylase (regulator of RNase III)
VAFPAISTGVFGYPVAEAAQVAIAAVRGADTSADEVRFVLFDDVTLEVFRGAIAR